MKKTVLSSLFLGLVVLSASADVTITNTNFTYPAVTNVTTADAIIFDIPSMHNAVEVSQATFDVNGNTSNGGFTIPFDGGTVPAGTLSAGTHYYVCTPHAGGGMKGTIVVTSSVGIASLATPTFNLYPNPVTENLTVELPEGADAVKVYDLTGKVLAEYNKIEAGTLNIGVLENRPAGVYFVSVANRKTIVTNKVMKK